MQTFIYLISAALLITAAYLVFNHVVVKDYAKKDRSGWWASTLQLAIFAAFFCFPSIYNLGWVLIWALIGHWMLTNEEIHLRRVFGEEYDPYCEKTPRY